MPSRLLTTMKSTGLPGMKKQISIVQLYTTRIYLILCEKTREVR
jgi:hypothetical protein